MQDTYNDLLGCWVEVLKTSFKCEVCQKRPTTRYLRWYDRTHGMSAEVAICGACLRSREASERKMQESIETVIRGIQAEALREAAAETGDPDGVGGLAS